MGSLDTQMGLSLLLLLLTSKKCMKRPSCTVCFSIYSAVIKVFQGEGLQMNELYLLNQRIR